MLGSITLLFLHYLLQHQKQPTSSGAIKGNLKHGIHTKLVANNQCKLSIPVVSKMTYSSFVVDVFAEFLQGMGLLFVFFSRSPTSAD
jgi:hypothetical protein